MDIRHYATWWELTADAFGDHTALIHGDLHRTWAQLDDRAARLAAALDAAGIGAGSKVGLFLYNGPEYLESQFAAFKVRAIPVNINYRYLDDELAYLLDDSEAEALVFHRSLADRVERVRDRLPRLRLLIEVDDIGEGIDGDGDAAGSSSYESLLAAHEPMPRIERPPTDKVMLYTGGTTGMPKGVVTTHGAQLEGLVGASWAMVGKTLPDSHHELPDRLRQVHEAAGGADVSLPAAPLMHGTGLWLGAMVAQCSAGTVVTLEGRSFDADELWRTVERVGVTAIAIVGDAFAKPMLRALDTARDVGSPYDTSSLRRLVSSGAMLSAESRSRILDHIPGVVIIDVLGSTETAIGVQLIMAGVEPETGVFAPLPTTKVLSPEGKPVEPGSGEHGLIAVAQPTTQGYYKDEAKTASLLQEFDGVVYAVTGDWATVEANGSIRLLGRGSQCINTGGEKVYPEEVEEAVKRAPGVIDCLVVGLPDERFGERVVAVVSTNDEPPPDAADIVAAVRRDLAAFKTPKQIVFVAEVPRAPNGKADYKGARALAESEGASLS